jgi:hypothetical protein
VDFPASATIWARHARDLAPAQEHRRVLMRDLPSRRPRPSRQPGLHAGRGRFAGPRHRRQHRHLQPAEQRAAGEAADAKAPALVLFTDPESQGIGIGSQSGDRALT